MPWRGFIAAARRNLPAFQPHAESDRGARGTCLVVGRSFYVRPAGTVVIPVRANTSLRRGLGALGYYSAIGRRCGLGRIIRQMVAAPTAPQKQWDHYPSPALIIPAYHP